MGKQKLNEKQSSSQPKLKIEKSISKEQVQEQDGAINISEVTEITCSICYSSIADQGIIKNCKHTYCFQCIQKWSEQNLTCPQCRADFTKVIRIRKVGQKAKKKTYKFKQPKQSNDTSLNINLIQYYTQLLFLMFEIYQDSDRE
ncbi:unnamed protein product (macronuclear) [Paramecium tetraurelia]|uniref:RING-type domain-containing protein n=1 Tax=Paramecium tetraurelia TaxID=5888 RepID=A0EBT3_PARTE|nr:uncharacterized protein GSPATT00025485001 [Paramecium tetraurelia]CAK92750.1 unnamed protein product [Paramecium tetraurelia]|eukprot:XP_001460147.1 hypothetical protein (macronuclear) [Paramecium tetraurelia strain d4-2]